MAAVKKIIQKKKTQNTYRELLKEYNKVAFPLGTRIRILDIDMEAYGEESDKQHIGKIFEVNGYQDTNLILKSEDTNNIPFVLFIGHDTFEVVTDDTGTVRKD